MSSTTTRICYQCHMLATTPPPMHIKVDCRVVLLMLIGNYGWQLWAMGERSKPERIVNVLSSKYSIKYSINSSYHHDDQYSPPTPYDYCCINESIAIVGAYRTEAACRRRWKRLAKTAAMTMALEPSKSGADSAISVEHSQRWWWWQCQWPVAAWGWVMRAGWWRISQREGFVAEREADAAAIISPCHSIGKRSAPGTPLSKIGPCYRTHKWCPHAIAWPDFWKMDKCIPFFSGGRPRRGVSIIA